MQLFLDEPTRSFTMLDEILEPFKPKTPYGRKTIEMLSCVLASEQQFHSHWYRLERILKQNEEFISSVERILERIPDLSHQIENGFVEISDFAKLKKFVYNFSSLYTLANSVWDLPDVDDIWKVLFHFFGDGEILQLQSEKLLALRKAHLILSEQLKKEFSRLCREINSLIGLRPNNEEFTIQAQIGKKLIDHGLAQLVKDYGERWHLRLIETEKMLQLRQSMKQLEEKMELEAEELLDEVRKQIQAHLDLLKLCEKAVTIVDIDLCRYKMYSRYNCCRPEVGNQIRVINGRFIPVLEYCEAKGYTYYPMNIEVKSGVTVLCGPNMGGKTTALKTVGAFVALFHLGFPIPSEYFSSPVFSNVRFISKGEEIGFSSFAREIRSFIRALQCHGRKLLLFDEFGTSTNPAEGEALTLAIVEHFSDSQDYVLLSTHYPRVVSAAKNVYSCGRIKNLEEEDPHRMLDYSLVPGAKHVEKIALKLAEKLGVPSEIVKKAENYSGG